MPSSFDQYETTYFGSSSCNGSTHNLVEEHLRTVSSFRKRSYKKECQERNLPLRLDAGPICLGIQPNCLNVHSSESGLPQAQCRVSSPRAKQRYASSSVWFHFTVVMAPIVSETTSLMVVHWMSGNAWSHWRVVAYGFIRLSEEA